MRGDRTTVISHTMEATTLLAPRCALPGPIIAPPDNNPAGSGPHWKAQDAQYARNEGVKAVKTAGTVCRIRTRAEAAVLVDPPLARETPG